MSSFSLIRDNQTESDLRDDLENIIQTRPFEVVLTTSGTNINIKRIDNDYYFTNQNFDVGYTPASPNVLVSVSVSPGERILLFAQTDPRENGIWDIISIIDGKVYIQRPPEYNKYTKIRIGQCVMILGGRNVNSSPPGFRGVIFINSTPDYDSNQNKIIMYNEISPQYWQFLAQIAILE